MNVLKHMEAVFVVTMAVALPSGYLLESLPAAQASAPVAPSADAAVTVVTVSARRMTADEKARSLQAELKAATSATTPARRI